MVASKTQNVTDMSEVEPTHFFGQNPWTNKSMAKSRAFFPDDLHRGTFLF